MFSATQNKAGVNLETRSHFLRCDYISRNSLAGKSHKSKSNPYTFVFLLDLRREGHFSDVTLDVFGTQIKAHKVNIFCSTL